MTRKFCVSISNCHKDPDKVVIGFMLASASLGVEQDTMVFLTTDGVWAAVQGEAEKINLGKPFSPLKESIERFIQGGGRILVCRPCMDLRAIRPQDLIPGAEPAGGSALLEFLADGTTCISF
jgi:predicted peroxiredoxin